MKYDYQKLKIKILVFVYDRTVVHKEKLFARQIYRKFRYYPLTTIHNALSSSNDVGFVDSKWTKKGNKWMREVTIPNDVRCIVKNFWKLSKKEK